MIERGGQIRHERCNVARLADGHDFLPSIAGRSMQCSGLLQSSAGARQVALV
jgi:hypothetical protein